MRIIDSMVDASRTIPRNQWGLQKTPSLGRLELDLYGLLDLDHVYDTLSPAGTPKDREWKVVHPRGCLSTAVHDFTMPARTA
jgi:hypothetical protein